MNREAVERRLMMLLLGAADMDQAVEAAAILREHESADENLQLVRALETALIVCYWRPFSQALWMGHLTKSDALDPEVHAMVRGLRDQTHAHIDVSSQRWAGIDDLSKIGFSGFGFAENWWGLGEEWAARIQAVAAKQRDAWREEALEIRSRLLQADE
jgi:hypothetical protein